MQYRLPTTGELVPLLQIAPSKSDAERMLLVSPELADVLAAIVARIRSDDGTIPLVASYDPLEKSWRPPLPLLLQHRLAHENRPITRNLVNRLLADSLAVLGATTVDGQPIGFRPHDFRRIFITEAILNGLPPHIAQIICGHADVATTLGYKAIYPAEAIEAHRAFLARRRSLRPAEEYRTPTDAEWDEFLGHFERRKVSIGTCGRAWATVCQHEHACIRCPMLRPDPTHRGRLVEIRDNLTDASAKPNAKAGSARSKDSPSAAPPPKRNSPNSTNRPPAAPPFTSACPTSPAWPAAMSPRLATQPHEQTQPPAAVVIDDTHPRSPFCSTPTSISPTPTRWCEKPHFESSENMCVSRRCVRCSTTPSPAPVDPR